LLTQIRPENESSETEETFLNLLIERSEDFEKQALPKNYVSPVILCIQTKLKKCLWTLIDKEPSLGLFFVEQTSGRSTIEYSFEAGDLDLTEQIIEKSVFPSWVVWESQTDSKTLLDLLENVWSAGVKRGGLLSGTEE
jgi:hypothetical protein